MTAQTIVATCVVDDCTRPIEARGLCRPHYDRDRRYGSPQISAPLRGSEATAALIEDIEWLLGFGESAEHVASRVGSNVRALQVRLRRNRRPDLAAIFEAAERATR